MQANVDEHTRVTNFDHPDRKLEEMLKKHPQARIAELEADRDNLIETMKHMVHKKVAEARCAAMREALGFALDCLTATPRADVYAKAFALKAVRAALSDDAGARMLAVVEAAKRYVCGKAKGTTELWLAVKALEERDDTR